MRISSSEYYIFILTAIVNALIPCFASGQSERLKSEGDFIIVTPYSSNDSITVEAIQTVKNAASKLRNVEDLRPNRIGKFHEIALAFVKDGMISSKPIYEFIGEDTANFKMIVDFSVIQSFRIIKFEGGLFSENRALVEITIFPNIKPDELLRVKPSYSDLRYNYTTQVRLWLKLQDSRYEELSLIGKSYSPDFQVITKIIDLKLYEIIHLGYDSYRQRFDYQYAIWWAVPSVINSFDYPYKLVISHSPPILSQPKKLGGNKKWLLISAATATAILIYALVK